MLPSANADHRRSAGCMLAGFESVPDRHVEFNSKLKPKSDPTPSQASV
jgi:hypothetical protein